MPNALEQQIAFIIEIDKLKQVLRQTLLTDGSRRENSAEHSWHIALMAVILQEYAPPEVDILHVIKLLLIHDLVEIDAGDTFCYDDRGNLDKAEREIKAAERLFGLLPPAQGQQLRQLWDEYEAQETIDSRYAKALDCLQPVLHNQQTQGGTWKLHGVTRDRIMKRISAVKEGAPRLWPFVLQLLDDCEKAGYFRV
ncbi:MAG: HD domain-containing protein [Desertifilum sp.]|nr:HD domain-containing protein [Desertifilum sp.]